MKKLLGIVVLGLLLSSCQTNDSTKKVQPERYYSGNEILRLDSTSATTINQILKYFDKHKTYYIYYSQSSGTIWWPDDKDFVTNSDIVTKDQCEIALRRDIGLTVDDCELLRTYKIDGIEKKDIPYFVKNYPNLPEVAIAKKTCAEIGYKPDDKDFKTCALTIIGIVNQREISHEKDMAYINAGGDIQSFEGWKVLNRVENYSKFPDIIKPKKTCIDVGYKSDDEEFKTCALTIMKIATEKEISHQQAFVDLYLGSNNASFNSFESWRILQRLDKAENRRRMNRQFKFACSLMGTCPKN